MKIDNNDNTYNDCIDSGNEDNSISVSVDTNNIVRDAIFV